MPIADDWAIDTVAKTVQHTSGTTIYTVNELYSWIQDEIDEAALMDDDVPMRANTPDIYEWINGWKMADEVSYQYLQSGALDDQVNGDRYVNIRTIGAIVNTSRIYVYQDGARITSWWPAGHIDVLVKVRAAGVPIDGGQLLILNREYGDNYDHFLLDASASLTNIVALSTSDDLANTTAQATVAGYNDITITFSNITRDLDNGNGLQPYAVEIDCAGRPLIEVFEYLKFVTRNGSVLLLNGEEGERYRAADPTFDEVKSAPFGAFAGGQLFAAQGVFLTNFDAADAKNYELIDSNGVKQLPPNVVPVQVTAVQAGDRVAMFRLTAPGGTIDKSRYTLAAGNNTGNGTVQVQQAIAADEPKQGVLRIGEDAYPYSDYSGSTFTLSGTLTETYSTGAGLYVPIIDQLATAATAQNTLKFSAAIPVLTRVRRKGILPFQIENLIGTNGLSVAAIRVTDTIVN